MNARLCSIDGCETPHVARGWCRAHYDRWWRLGEIGLAGLRRRPSDPVAFSKVCSRCGIDKPKTEFYADRSPTGIPRNLDGRASHCKVCAGVQTRELRRRRLYGMPLGTYDRLVAEQDGRCPICNDQTKLVVDHDHDTGRVRALLCDPCNRLLSIADESPDVLRRAADYLDENAAATAKEVS